MAAPLCLVPIKFCAARFTLLADDGTVSNTTGNYFVTNQVVTLGFTPVYSEGQDREVRNGCDCIIAADLAPNLFKRFTFELSKGALEPALEAMLLGQDPILDPVTPTSVIGINYLTDQITCVGTQGKVMMEGWTQGYEVDHQSGTYPWIHYRWPSTSWTLGANTLGADFQQEALVGFSRTNTEVGDPFADLPADGTSVIDSSVFSFWYTDDDPPDASCGLQTVVVV